MATQIERVLAAVKNGPVTTRDVAAFTALPMKRCCIYLRILWEQDVLERKPHPRTGAGGKRYIYQLARNGASQ